MRITHWRSAVAASVAMAGLVGWLAGPTGASTPPLPHARMWHGMRIQSLDAVPAQFLHARAAASSHPLSPLASSAWAAATRLARSESTATAGTMTIPLTGTTTTGTPTTTTGTTGTPPPTTGPPPDVILSNESTFSRWAYVNARVWIRRHPWSTAKRIVRTHWFTEDGFPEVYLALRKHTDPRGHVWIDIRIPRRPNGQTGWVPRRALGRLHLTHQLIVVNRAKTRMYLYDRGRQVWSAPVGVGKASTPTPAGHFWIRERFKIAQRSSGYYPYAFGTSDYSTLTDWPGGGVVGIHGPYYDPQGIPGHISHGCIRLEVAADAWLAHHITLGVPLHVI
jgi:hypothetical protein